MDPQIVAMLRAEGVEWTQRSENYDEVVVVLEEDHHLPSSRLQARLDAAGVTLVVLELITPEGEDVACERRGSPEIWVREGMWVYRGQLPKIWTQSWEVYPTWAEMARLDRDWSAYIQTGVWPGDPDDALDSYREVHGHDPPRRR